MMLTLGCVENEFTCNDKKCIPLEFKEDGSFDCDDRSDETNACKCLS